MRPTLVPGGDRLLSPQTVADRLDCTVMAVRARIKRKQIETVKVGKRNYVRESWLDEYIATRPPRDPDGQIPGQIAEVTDAE